MLEVALEGAGVFDLESLLFPLEADEICEISGSCDAILSAVVVMALCRGTALCADTCASWV